MRQTPSRPILCACEPSVRALLSNTQFEYDAFYINALRASSVIKLLGYSNLAQPVSYLPVRYIYFGSLIRISGAGVYGKPFADNGSWA